MALHVLGGLTQGNGHRFRGRVLPLDHGFMGKSFSINITIIYAESLGDEVRIRMPVLALVSLVFAQILSLKNHWCGFFGVTILFVDIAVSA